VSTIAAPAPAPRSPVGAPGLQHRREWFLSTLFVVGGATAILAGIAGVVRVPDRPLRVGANFWIGYEPLRLVSGTSGTAAPRVVELRSTSAVLEGLRAGTLDAAALTIDEAVRHSGPDLALAIVLVLDRSQGADAVLARPSAGRVPAPGARIAVETESVGALLLARFLDASGLTEREVRIVDMPASAHDSAFASAAVDYLVTYEPHVSALERRGATRVFDSRQMGGDVVDVLVVRKDVLATRSGDVGGMVAGWYRGLERMRRTIANDPSDIERRLDLPSGGSNAILRGLAFPSREENQRMLTDGTVEAIVSRMSTWVRATGTVDAGRWLSVAAAPSAR